ncbi:uncharacterized protein EV422DRAFT_229232 [Fimicolochytrium jonesii]|uniref:uncharacterized protein n=1 Tax=Fimicolochytrium jonesii TaxID=1396493 RepID=UPI0022FED09D|nr:uncharacterized protein EV422DRAFT_229232 [Fimicolochytrium jonesii]KAI8817253.1 hypothetical protein EV422DRAFT_229232 [Fimicolochytrium jonesii]
MSQPGKTERDEALLYTTALTSKGRNAYYPFVHTLCDIVLEKYHSNSTANSNPTANSNSDANSNPTANSDSDANSNPTANPNSDANSNPTNSNPTANSKRGPSRLFGAPGLVPPEIVVAAIPPSPIVFVVAVVVGPHILIVLAPDFFLLSSFSFPHTIFRFSTRLQRHGSISQYLRLLLLRLSSFLASHRQLLLDLL